MKAIFMLSDSGKDETGSHTVTIMLTEAYRFGTEDILDFSRAIDVFQRAGGQEIANACNDVEGIVLALQSAFPTTAKTTSSAAALKPSSVALPPLPFVPMAINLHGREESVPRYASAFLESLQWLQRANTGYDGSRVLEVVHDHDEHLFARVRLVSSARNHQCDLQLDSHFPLPSHANHSFKK